MTVQEIMGSLKSLGSESTRKILLNHGMKEPLFGVKISDLKPIEKKIKKDYKLAKDLYATGNADAMYLAGLIADDEKMTKADLQLWVRQAVSQNISEYTVPWVAAGSHHGFELALEWIESKEEHIAAAGWSTLSAVVSMKDDKELDIPLLKKLLSRIVQSIQPAKGRIRHTMNGFVIALGAYVKELTTDALSAAKKIGTVTVNMNGTASKAPDAAAYILKIKDKGGIGKKKKTVKC